jgi:hypothetical protein
MDEINEKYYARLFILMLPSLKQIMDAINDNGLSPKTKILILKLVKKKLEEDVKITYLEFVNEFFEKFELDKKDVISYSKSFLPENHNFVVSYTLN